MNTPNMIVELGERGTAGEAPYNSNLVVNVKIENRYIRKI
jgi:hypothetical protein